MDAQRLETLSQAADPTSLLQAYFLPSVMHRLWSRYLGSPETGHDQYLALRGQIENLGINPPSRYLREEVEQLLRLIDEAFELLSAPSVDATLYQEKVAAIVAAFSVTATRIRHPDPHRWRYEIGG